jgi:hypothetical protein
LLIVSLVGDGLNADLKVTGSHTLIDRIGYQSKPQRRASKIFLRVCISSAAETGEQP